MKGPGSFQSQDIRCLLDNTDDFLLSFGAVTQRALGTALDEKATLITGVHPVREIAESIDEWLNAPTVLEKPQDEALCAARS